MSLKVFHIFFISLSLVLGISMIGFDLLQKKSSIVGVVGGLFLVCLIPYLVWFQKKMKKLSVVILIFVSSFYTPKLIACSVCYGDPSSPFVQSLKGGVFFLGGLILAGLGVILAIACSWAKRERMLQNL